MPDLKSELQTKVVQPPTPTRAAVAHTLNYKDPAKLASIHVWIVLALIDNPGMTVKQLENIRPSYISSISPGTSELIKLGVLRREDANDRDFGKPVYRFWVDDLSKWPDNKAPYFRPHERGYTKPSYKKHQAAQAAPVEQPAEEPRTVEELWPEAKPEFDVFSQVEATLAQPAQRVTPIGITLNLYINGDCQAITLEDAREIYQQLALVFG